MTKLDRSKTICFLGFGVLVWAPWIECSLGRLSAMTGIGQPIRWSSFARANWTS
jgi:hypothetical protein